MLLTRVLQRNPELVAAAIELHQRGEIPPGTYVVDLDAIAENARLLAAAAKSAGLRVYVMTKQHGRNPYVTKVALSQGLDSTIAVEMQCARLIHRYGIPLGHVGHLCQVPKGAAREVVRMRPDVVTVFTLQAAKNISEAAQAEGITQNLYVRVINPHDESWRNMMGGWSEDDCVEGIRPILDLPNVRVVGLTTFVNISYASPTLGSAKPTGTFYTMLRCKKKLERAFGLKDLRVNAPALNNTQTFGLLADEGATDVEPGIGLLGSSLLHAYQDLPERPAQVLVSEISHHWLEDAYCLGGGLDYIESNGREYEYTIRAAVGTTLEKARENFLPLEEVGHLDYHGVLGEGHKAHIGDSVVFALRAQFFVTRAYQAVVSGISSGEPKLEALFDAQASALDRDYNPIAPADVIADIDALIGKKYSAVAAG